MAETPTYTAGWELGLMWGNSCTYVSREDPDALWNKIQASRAALKEFLRVAVPRIFLPVLLVFRRYDFRGCPRWKSRRWKAKT